MDAINDNTDLERHRRALCDQLVERSAEMMVDGAGAPIAMMVDRMLTYALAQSCSMAGAAATAAMLRDVADKIEGGLFHRVTGSSGRRH